MPAIRITTLPGDRWDLLAVRCYGTQAEVDRLVQANPHVPLGAVLPAGTELNVPLVDETVVLPTAATLPPWKR